MNHHHMYYSLANKKGGLFTVREAANRYVVGMPSRAMTDLIIRRLRATDVLDKPRSPYIQRSMAEDIAEEVNAELGMLGLEKYAMRDLVVDTDAKVVFHKSARAPPLRVRSLTAEQFVMLPFESSLGIVMAEEVVLDNESLLVVQGQLVQPAFCQQVAVNKLAKLHAA